MPASLPETIPNNAPITTEMATSITGFVQSIAGVLPAVPAVKAKPAVAA